MAAVPSYQRAWQCHGFNEDPAKAIEDLKIAEDAPVPVPGEGQVLIRTAYASINPIDWKLFTGKYEGLAPIAKFPYVPVFDVAGTVAAVGPGVTKFKVGDRVAANFGVVESCKKEPTFGPAGGLAQYSTAPESIVALVPEGVPLSVAAALALAGQTSYQALFTSGNTSLKGEPLGSVSEGSKVLILGGPSGTGHIAVQLAKIKGAQVATTASPNTLADGRTKIEWLQSLGADLVINYREQDWAEVLKGQDYDLIYDCVGTPEDWPKAAAVLKKGGQFVSVANFAPNESTEDHAFKVMLVRALSSDLDQMLAWVVEGKLKVHVDQVIKFEDAPKAIAHNLSGKATGKVVVEIGP